MFMQKFDSRASSSSVLQGNAFGHSCANLAPAQGCSFTWLPALVFLASRAFFCPVSTLPLRQRCQGTWCASLCLFPCVPQVDQLKCKVTSLEEECSLLRKQAAVVPQREAEERGHPDTVSELWAENQRLMASLQELQGTLQVPPRAELPRSHTARGWEGSLGRAGQRWVTLPSSVTLGCAHKHRSVPLRAQKVHRETMRAVMLPPPSHQALVRRSLGACSVVTLPPPLPGSRRGPSAGL